MTTPQHTTPTTQNHHTKLIISYYNNTPYLATATLTTHTENTTLTTTFTITLLTPNITTYHNLPYTWTYTTPHLLTITPLNTILPNPPPQIPQPTPDNTQNNTPSTTTDTNDEKKTTFMNQNDISNQHQKGK